MTELKHSYLYSALLHVVLAGVVVFVGGLERAKHKPKTTIKFKVIEKPVAAKPKAVVPPPVKKQEIKKKPPPKKVTKRKVKKKIKKARKVFGVSKKSLTSKKAGAAAVKRGNTIATQVDQKKLRQDDVEELPIPTAEYLVTAMPTVLSAAKITYPAGMRLEGTVLLDVLVDEKGRVRDATVVESLAAAMDAEALRAIKRYRFSPAQIDDRPVAVRIRYAIKFVLEND